MSKTVMQKITPHLWFDKEAKEASEFYAEAFGNNSKITNVTTLHTTPSGDCDVVSFIDTEGNRISILQHYPMQR